MREILETEAVHHGEVGGAELLLVRRVDFEIFHVEVELGKIVAGELVLVLVLVLAEVFVLVGEEGRHGCLGAR